MFVYNISLSSRKIFKLILILIFAIAIIITGVAIYKTFNSKESVETDDVYTIPSTNYTNVLKAVHDDIDTYVGQKIAFSRVCL